MMADRWGRIGELFEAVLAQPEAERESFLDDACGSDTDLREEVRSLLAHHRQRSPLEVPAAGWIAGEVDEPEPVPATIARYRVLEPLGAGGMGIVYRAEDPTLGRTVALKVLAPAWLRDPKARERFQREARAAAALDHPNICTVYEVGTTDEGRPFLAMPCYRGETLAAKIARRPLNPDQALALALQIAAGLACAHAGGMVHRDVKPANLWVTDDGVVKILDFGIAKRPEQESLTVAGARLGTTAYMAPEQIRGGKVDARADVWACGVVLLEMLTGRPPFTGASAEESLYRIVHGRPDGLDDIPEAVARVLARALANEPAARYANAEELRAALAEVRLDPGSTFADEEGALVAGDVAGDGRGESPPSPHPAATRSWRSRTARPGPMAAALLVAAAVGLALWGRLGDRAEAPPLAMPPAVGQPSLAVLPLENLGTPDQQQFADGMTEAITTQLAKIEALKVISRSAVQPYRTDRPRPSQIARELGVTSLVEGSALLVGDRVRITAQLIDGDSEHLLWAESYEGDLRDILALQSRVAQAIVRAVRVRVTPDEQRRIAAAQSIRPEAFRAYVDGLYHFERSRRIDDDMFSSVRASIASFEEAAKLEPNWGEAHGKLARAHTVLAGMSDDHSERLLQYRLARRSAERALELDPGVVSARMVLGRTLLFLDGDWEGAEREYREALRLEPNHTDFTFATFFSWAGRTEEALAVLRQAQERWPGSTFLGFQTGLAHLCGGNPDGATAVADELRDRYADTVHASLLDAMVATRRGDHERALEILERHREALLVNRATSFHDTLSYAAAKAGRRDLAERSIRELEGLGGLAGPSTLLALGDAEAARHTIEERYRARDYSLLAARCWPEYENLKRLPGVEAILREVGPPERH